MQPGKDDKQVIDRNWWKRYLSEGRANLEEEKACFRRELRNERLFRNILKFLSGSVLNFLSVSAALIGQAIALDYALKWYTSSGLVNYALNGCYGALSILSHPSSAPIMQCIGIEAIGASLLGVACTLTQAGLLGFITYTKLMGHDGEFNSKGSEILHDMIKFSYITWMSIGVLAPTVGAIMLPFDVLSVSAISLMIGVGMSFAVSKYATKFDQTNHLELLGGELCTGKAREN
jgi:hypothetical protein